MRSLLLFDVVQLHATDNIEATQYGQLIFNALLGEAWPAIIICGVLGGFFGGSFSTILIFMTRRIANFARRQPIVLAFGCGLLVSLLGFLSGGDTFGTGYDQARALITGEEQTNLMYPI